MSDSPSRSADPALALLLALLVGQFVVVLTHYQQHIGNDEDYWSAKGRYIAEHHRFAPLDPHALAVEGGREWGNSDWRPQGYALFVAIVSGGDFHDIPGDLRLALTVTQFLLLATILVALYQLAARAGAHRWLAALILGLSPWTFEFVNRIFADPLNAFVATLGLILLWRSNIFLGTLVFSTTLLLRPEMFVLPPLMAVIAILLRGRPRWRDFGLAAAAFALVAGAQLGYRASVNPSGGVYGGLHISNSGAFHWANTWPGTEKEGYDFVYVLTEGRTPPPLPARAFAHQGERNRVSAIVSRVVASHTYLQSDDAAFEQLARERRQRAPVTVALLRLWHAAHLWVNLENPDPLLGALARLSRAERRPILGGLLALKLAIFALAAVAAARALARLRGGIADTYDRLTLLMASFIAGRTLLIGLMLNWKVHRYALAAWPAMLWCAVAALRPSRTEVQA